VDEAWSCPNRYRKGERSMSIITILIIVLVVLLVAGFLGRGRF
jgi:flagellar basal body-associated protein FliL